MAWQARKPRLGEVLVERQRLPQPALLHHNKRDAIRQREPLVVMADEIIPAFSEECFVDVNDFDRRGLQELRANLDGASMAVASIEMREDFIDNETRGNQSVVAFPLPPMVRRPGLILIPTE